MEGNTGKGFTVSGVLLTSWIAFRARNSLPLVAMSTAEGWRSRAAALGGYTTLCGLTFHTEFAVGASYYGISDLVALATETHKFELHYTDWLIEPFRPNSALYYDRSPINFTDRLSAPVIFLHGKDDQVVPINQAQRMYSALQRRNIPTCLLIFQDEKHGFRQSAHLRQALEAELLFYSINLTRAPLTS